MRISFLSTKLPARLVAMLLAVALGIFGCGDDDGNGAGSGGTSGTGGTAGTGPLDTTFKAAACARDITPVTDGLAAAYETAFGTAGTVNHTEPVFLAGFGNDRQATGYNDRLWARGVVVGGPGGRVAIVSIDLVGYFNNEIDTARALVSPDSGIDYVVVSSTHQHEGPDTLGLWGSTQLTSGIDPGYLDFVNQSIADCIDDAASSLVEARMRTETTDSIGLSMGMDAEDDGMGVADGKVLVGDVEAAPATEGRITDARLSIMQLTERDPAGDGTYPVLATLVNFASHPESLGSGNTLVTSDFPHYARERLEQEYGGTAVWVVGALGVLQGPLDIDVLDPDTSEAAPRRTFRFAEVHGTQLAERVIGAIDTMAPGDDAPEIAWERTAPVAVQLDNPFFRFVGAVGLLGRRSLYTNGEPDDSTGPILPPPFETIIALTGDDVLTEVGAIRVGDASFAVVPTELDPQRGEVYRDGMIGAEDTFIIGLGNDHIGYQVPFDKWDNSCNECFPYVLRSMEEECPTQPIDCGTVFQNNVGRELDPSVSEPLLQLIDDLH